MKYYIFLLLVFAVLTSFSQLSTMRSPGPTGIYKSTYDHTHDTTVFYPNGRIKYKMEISDSAQGIYTDFEEKNGEMISRLNYRMENNTVLFQHIEIWNGTFLKSEAHYNSSATTRNVMYYFDNSEQIWLKYSQDVNVPTDQQHYGYNGLYQEYYRNGKLRTEGNFENGVKAGEWSNYFENGQLESKGNYTNSFSKFTCTLHNDGKVHYIIWDSRTNDTIQTVEGERKDNDKELRERYDMTRDGVTFFSGHIYYHRNGIWEYWNQDGTLILRKQWEYGELKKTKKVRKKKLNK